MGSCNQCGMCCRVIKLEQSPEEVKAMALLTGVLGIPSDNTFAAEHWRPLTREEAMRINPFYVSQLPDTAHFYSCDRLGEDGRCRAHDVRPLVCRGYPWYDRPPRVMPVPDPQCGYLEDQAPLRGRATQP